MRVLVYPHAMEIGGSQLNAVELAGAVRDLGHEVAVVAEPGPLVATVERLGLEHVPIPEHRRRPSPEVVRLLVRLTRERRIDVVHGHEWPPALEAVLGPRLVAGAAAVGTVMSAVVAPFLPESLPLVVGTEALREEALRQGWRDVTLIEPPVDVVANSPSADPGDFRARHGLPDDVPLVAVVCRLVEQLKLEGLLTACEAVGELARDGVPVRLAIVGDGDARPAVEAAAERANACAGQRVVVLAGELADPRPAYAAADVMLGMGGSALRGMAFGRPLVVQGERGFWRLCTPATLPGFLAGGWYGLGGDGAATLRAELEPLLRDADRRRELGLFARGVVESRFALPAAAARQVGVYERALAAPRRVPPAELARATALLGRYKVHRRLERIRGRHAVDDFNSLAAMAR